MSAGARGGFTLIEVLIAMVILAVGLLGLQAMQIVGARSIARAGRITEQTLRAVRTAEQAAAAIRRAEVVGDRAWEDPVSKDTIRQTVVPGPPVRVRVTVVPNPSGHLGLKRGDSVSVSLIP